MKKERKNFSLAGPLTLRTNRVLLSCFQLENYTPILGGGTTPISKVWEGFDGDYHPLSQTYQTFKKNKIFKKNLKKFISRTRIYYPHY